MKTRQICAALLITAVSPFTLAQHAASSPAAVEYGKLPLSFEANQGQTDPKVKFVSRGQGYTLFLTNTKAVLTLSPINSSATRLATTDVVRMELIGSSLNPHVAGADELPGNASYFFGNDPARWRTSVATYGRVKYVGVYPGTDLVYYGNQRQLEYDFVLAPGADPKPVKLHFAGAEKLKIDSAGDLTISASKGKIAFHKPVVYQILNGHREAVAGRFTLLANNTVGFRIGNYDHARELVIDPTLAYSTYLGGTVVYGGIGDSASSIATDDAGNAYVTGVAHSLDFPVTSGSFQSERPSEFPTVFVTKINSSGSALVYSTYLGGDDLEAGQHIAVDSEGAAYIAGYTSSSNFPLTAGAFQTHLTQQEMPFLTKLNPAGNALVYSTLLGGSVSDRVNGLAVNTLGEAYAAGQAYSLDFPVTPHAFLQENPSASPNCFVTRLNSTGTALVYSTLLGASDYTACNGIAVDAYNKAYVTGFTMAKDFPTTAGAFQRVKNSPNVIAFVTKFNPSGSALAYSTYLGGSVGETSDGIVLDAARNAYIYGVTESSDFPVTSGAYQTSYRPDVYFVSKLDPTGSSLVYSTFFGTELVDDSYSISSIAVDTPGHVFLAGYTSSKIFPVTPGVAQRTYGGVEDAFLSRLSIDGSALSYSTYFGGELFETLPAVAVDTAGNAYLAGGTDSRTLHVTAGAFQTRNHADRESNAYVAKFAFSDAAFTSTGISSSHNSQTDGAQVTFTASIAPVTGHHVPTGFVSFRVDGSPLIHVAVDANGHAAYSTTSLAPGQHTITAAYLGSSTYAPSSANLVETIAP